ncbi:MAG: hypothetical protein ACI9UA_005330 [Pseudoalteromonas tetraodonis]|jgi:hypothetical protein
MSSPQSVVEKLIARRAFLRGAGSAGLGTLAFNQLFQRDATAAARDPNLPVLGHIAPTAKSVIFLHMVGAPSHVDLFDPKPKLKDFHGKPAPAEFVEGKRFAFLRGHPKMMASPYEFESLNEGQEISELLPHLKTVAGEIAIVRSMKSDEFNHAPAQMFMHSGLNRIGRPSMGSWVTYGLGSECNDLPAYVVMISGGIPGGGSSLWDTGFLPSVFQGVEFRSQGDPVLFLSNPEGVDRSRRRRILDGINRLNATELENTGDPEIRTRMAQYELAFKMQMSVPELTDVSSEPDAVREMYGEGDFAGQCLQARRLVERGVRFVELYDSTWDHHKQLDKKLREKCKQTDQPVAALIKDLKMRGLLDDTLVVWGSEFGRTPMIQGDKIEGAGRDHHKDAFSIWMAGGGVRGGISHGQTDEFGFEVTRDPVQFRDLHATILHALGIDHERVTFRFQGLDQKLTGTEEAAVQTSLFT